MNLIISGTQKTILKSQYATIVGRERAHWASDYAKNLPEWFEDYVAEGEWMDILDNKHFAFSKSVMDEIKKRLNIFQKTSKYGISSVNYDTLENYINSCGMRNLDHQWHRIMDNCIYAKNDKQKKKAFAYCFEPLFNAVKIIQE